MADTPFKHKLVVVVRTDLKLSPGKLAVQVAHAAVDCALSAKRDHPSRFKDWFNEGQKKVVVKGTGVEELGELKERARRLGLTACLIRDAGMTEVEAGTVTCLGLGPGPAAMVDQLTGKHPLW